jgi:uncharacterized protein DUF4339/T4 superinfection immunity protein
MSEQIPVTPPPLPNADEPPGISIKRSEWHYVAHGVGKGPVSAAVIMDLLNKKEIETDTPVWREGMTDWKSIRESDLAELVATELPTFSHRHNPLARQSSSAWLWCLLVAGAIGLVVGLVVALNARTNPTALGIIVTLAVIIIMYGVLLPTVIAFQRHLPNRVVIMFLNILGFWTGILWVVAMGWSLTDVQNQEEE